NIEYYKVDVFKDKVFVFTPRGDVKELPQGSTAIDFAYMIHTNVGNSCKGIKVNNVIKPLDYVLHTGDVVEVLVDKKKHLPSHDWLSFVTTPYAKANIRRALRTEEEIAEDEEKEAIDEEIVEEEEKQLVTPGEKEEYIQTEQGGVVRIKGIDNINCSIAKCCAPIPGDDIIGHVTKTRGIKIHKKDCKELSALAYKVLLEAEWVKTQQEFLTGIYVQSASQDTAQMIKDISRLLSDMKIEVKKMDSWNNNGFNGKIAINVTSKGQLDNLIKKIKRIQKVSTVERINITE
ncbi:MAG: bifunctional (p)ppGpp synthetase/guanosine-3',5'-bis(diphosphate) 3'-pyrophosphohydrolase, partial [Patescibacteria group bacterium]|nr:bifunctional (p)ppGpp synthetase/guanosine-3',5'-bis(diphosphate) 3'-pyrophosphohydrolase [Patescibacteria group bacterium]